MFPLALGDTRELTLVKNPMNVFNVESLGIEWNVEKLELFAYYAQENSYWERNCINVMNVELLLSLS